jgi:3-methyl-2-oxobutanoate hydroxymethyltransferase
MPLTIAKIKTRKHPEQPLVCLTAYTTPMARSLAPHVDLLLVGDSVGTVLYGMDNTTGVTIEIMIGHGQAVMRGQTGLPVIIDMPFGTYENNPAQALENAQRILRETGADGVKLEGGVDVKDQIATLTKAGIAVMGHIGLQPQSVIKDGGYKIKGKDDAQTQKLIEDAKAVEAAGAFAMVIEGTIAEAASKVTKAVSIPTIGIGGSSDCDGQILVTEDLLGLLHGHRPKFVTEYAHLREDIDTAIAHFAADVRARKFPRAENLYELKK